MLTVARPEESPAIGGVDFNVSRYPLVVITYEGTMTDQDLARLHTVATRTLLRREKHVTIIDLSQAGLASAVHRKKQAEWVRDHADLIRTYSLGAAFVVCSPLVRGVLTAIFWMQPLPHEHHIVGTLFEAERWANERLRMPTAATRRPAASNLS